MQFTKPMIELVYEIRRRVDADLKPAIKLANPDMLQELAQCYGTCKDAVTKALIKELFHLAGDAIADLCEMTPGGKPAVQIYRGQISVNPTATPATTSKPNTDTQALAPTSESRTRASQRIYRGQIIDF